MARDVKLSCTMPNLLAVLAVIGFVYWAFVALSVFRVIRGVPLVEDLAPADPVRWPRVSVIVPACNEDETLDRAMRSRLGEGYPDAEYIVVDDRSTDRTGAIVDQLARDDSRVVPVHVEELPDGWLGKVHAMHVGVGRSTGEWILLSDADIHHEPGTLARIVAHCEEQGIDHVAVFPSIWSSTFSLDVVMNAFLRLIAVTARAWKVGDPSSRVSVGGGVFNLFRRSALERAGGLEPLKLEVVDDAALGQMLKWSGARQAVFNARGFVGLWYYRSVVEAVRGMEKNGFALLGRLNMLRLVLTIALLSIVEFGAFAAVAGGSGWSRVVAGIALAIGCGAQVTIARWFGRPLLPAVLGPLGTMVMVFAALRSGVLALARGGIDWRGTRYPLDVLRRGMRLVIA